MTDYEENPLQAIKSLLEDPSFKREFCERLGVPEDTRFEEMQLESLAEMLDERIGVEHVNLDNIRDFERLLGLYYVAQVGKVSKREIKVILGWEDEKIEAEHKNLVDRGLIAPLDDILSHAFIDEDDDS